MIRSNIQGFKSKNKIYKILNLNHINNKYVAYPWPEYQEYMGEEWFREECYYCADKDVYFIPVNRVNTASTDNGLDIYDICITRKTN